jgi:hypothetical protein
MDHLAYENEDLMLESTNQFFAMKGEFHISLLGSKDFRNSNFDLSMDTSD